MNDQIQEYLTIFAENVRRARKSQKLTQRQLAKRVGCHVNAIGNIERSQADPTLSMILKISKSLKVNIEDLIIKDKTENH